MEKGLGGPVQNKQLLKAFGHALQFRCQRVYGLLIGEHGSQTEYTIAETVPVAHHEFIGTAAATTLAIVDAYLREKKSNRSIIGVYWFPLDDCLERGTRSKILDLSVEALVRPILAQAGKCVVLKGRVDGNCSSMESVVITKTLPKTVKWEVMELGASLIDELEKTVLTERYKDIADMEQFFLIPAYQPTIDC